MKSPLVFTLLLVAALGTQTVGGAVRLGAPFADHMVLQREKPVCVWGTAEPGEKVTVAFAGQKVTATADGKGGWKLHLAPLAASKEARDFVVTSTPQTHQTSQTHQTILHDIIVGEVWFAGGQSNMGVPAVWHDPRFGDKKGAMIAQYVKRPYVRFAQNNPHWQMKPVRDGRMAWKDFRWENVKSGEGKGSRFYGFSAIAYYYALELYAELDVPIGVIASYNGGTNIEAWIPRAGYEAYPELHEFIEKYPVTKEEWEKNEKALTRGGIKGGPFRQPTVLWNGGIEPFTPYTIRGAIWYQGCNNSGDPEHYLAFQRALYAGWTKKFENPGMPFYLVQLAAHNGGESWARLQEAQAAFAAETPNAEIAIANDVGSGPDVHPKDKQIVSQRLALHAFRNLYGYTGIQSRSPTLESHRIEGGSFVLKFRDAKRLYVYNENRSYDVGFQVAGADGVWKKAEILNFTEKTDYKGRKEKDGEVMGDTLVVGAKDVPNPVKLRYLYEAPHAGCLFNEVNLPVGTFHID